MKIKKVLTGLAFTLVSLVATAHTQHSGDLDMHALPLGDGKISAQPKAGYVFSCAHQFRGGGARHSGDWIHGNTWDPSQKIAVQGSVAWPAARFRIVDQATTRELIGNDLPVDASTGIFPIQVTDPAYRIDRNPNAIEQQRVRLSLPRNPQFAARASCVPMGMVGVMLNGVALFNALDDAGHDAVAHEVQDRCHGHPQHRGEYHYHGPSPCIPGINGKAKLVGYALDGFGIYSMRDADGRELTNRDLDACHGRTSQVMWDGKRVMMYHYVMTREYPYSIGCFRGTPVMLTRYPRSRRARFEPQRGRRGGPPRMAIRACADQTPGDTCQFTTPRGDLVQGVCRSPGGELACVPGRRP